jgi:hypothetical protein
MEERHNNHTEDTEKRKIFCLSGDLPAIASRSGEAGGYRQTKSSPYSPYKGRR